MARHDPYRNFKLRIELDGRLVAGFSEVEVRTSLAKVKGRAAEASPVVLEAQRERVDARVLHELPEG